MSSTHVSSLDPQDDTAYDEFFAVYAACHDRPWDTPYAHREKRVVVRADDGYTDRAWFVAREDGVAVGWAMAELSLKDNTHLAWIDGGVIPTHRREGHGTRLLEHVLADPRVRARRTAAAEAAWDLGTETSSGRRLLERHGFVLGQLDAHRVLRLPADLPAVSPQEPYRLRSWSGRCPAEWVDDYAGLRARMLTEAPAGDMELEAEFFDAARVRREEDELADQDRVMFTTVAVGPADTLAGHSQLVVAGADQVNAYQWDTLVLPEHRGHRLGYALKVRNLHEADRALGQRRWLHTWNADSNRPMVDVNEQMGFELVEYMGEMQRVQ